MSEVLVELDVNSTNEIVINNVSTQINASIEDVYASIETYVSQVGPVGVDSNRVFVQPTGSISSTTLKGALEELSKQSYSSSVVPTFINKGTTWYNTEENQYYVYREVSTGVLQWVPIMVGNESENSDTVDAGAF